MLMSWWEVILTAGILSGALVPKGVQQRPIQCQLLEIAQDHCLSQVVNIHTPNDKTLDLLLTNSPSPVNRVKRMPLIGKADHDIVYVEYNIKPNGSSKPRERFFCTIEWIWKVYATI